MTLRAVILFLVIGTTVGCSAYYSDFGFTGFSPDHSKFDNLLKTYVDSTGWVDYPGLLSSRDQLQQYLSMLGKNPPDSSWTRQEKLAYWINAYNAFTIELVLQHYPIQSIREIGSSIQIPFVNSPWDIKFIEIGDRCKVTVRFRGREMAGNLHGAEGSSRRKASCFFRDVVPR